MGTYIKIEGLTRGVKLECGRTLLFPRNLIRSSRETDQYDIRILVPSADDGFGEKSSSIWHSGGQSWVPIEVVESDSTENYQHNLKSLKEWAEDLNQMIGQSFQIHYVEFRIDPRTNTLGPFGADFIVGRGTPSAEHDAGREAIANKRKRKPSLPTRKLLLA